jgi:hypothetical protein
MAEHEILPLLPDIIMNNIETNKTKYVEMVRLWPITVEIYPSGQIAFVARPFDHARKRWNRSFSTSRFGSPEECASRAIEFCKRILEATDPEVKEDIIEREYRKAARYGVTKEEAALWLELKQMGVDVEQVLQDAHERATLAKLQAKWGTRK